MYRKFLVPILALIAASAMNGCGAPGAPQPPSLNLPIPVANLSATRVGDSVHLAWTMPTHTTDRRPLKHPLTANVCRAAGSGSCTNIAKLVLAPAKAGTYTDDLPPDFAKKTNRLLRYEISLPNRAGKSAGPSNFAYTAAGTAPPALTGLTSQLRPDGVLLSWTPASEPETAVTFRIERLLLTAPPPKEQDHSSVLGAPAPPAAQTLVVHDRDRVDPGHALDTSATSNQRYRYVVERVATFDAEGHTAEIQGSPSDAIEVSTKDTFPPVVPQGLVAVADTAGAAIDLSWTPDSDTDLAAYHIYRRDVAAALPAQRIGSSNGETSFRDTAVRQQHTYAYSVSAIDQSGNESKPSTEVEETLPRP
jgi:hypothetical protein